MKILFISNINEKKGRLNDYMSDILLHGLREIYGDSVIDYPGVWYMYPEEVKRIKYDINNLWGKGFTLYNLLSNYHKIDRTDIEKKIKTNYFDFIIFGSIHKSRLFFSEAINSKSKIIFVDGDDHQFIDKQITKNGVYFKRELVSDYVTNVYPINFAIPKEKIVQTINSKPINLLSPIIPGKNSSQIYKNEQDYNQVYQNSIFALTYKKIGWDSLRHYEILMNGCIPLFFNINHCPEKTLTKLPKQMLFDIFNQYSWILNQFFPTKIYKLKFLSIEKFFLFFNSLFKKKNTGISFINTYPEIVEIKEKLINYTKKNLTTKNVAKDIISDTLKYYL